MVFNGCVIKFKNHSYVDKKIKKTVTMKKQKKIIYKTKIVYRVKKVKVKEYVSCDIPDIVYNFKGDGIKPIERLLKYFKIQKEYLDKCRNEGVKKETI